MSNKQKTQNETNIYNKTIQAKLNQKLKASKLNVKYELKVLVNSLPRLSRSKLGIKHK